MRWKVGTAVKTAEDGIGKGMTKKIDWLRGCATALVTPFKKDGSIDDECFKSLVDRQIQNGINLLVPCGTTGESATMSDEERVQVIRMTVAAARGKGAYVIAGTGSNNTAATIDFTRKVRELGADAALVVGPYYNKPTQEGMFAHFSEIAGSVRDFPIMLYNVPGRTAANITAATQLRIAEACPNVVATKEASGNFSQIMEIIRDRPANFRVFSGDDMTAVGLIAVGADGLISVCSNELPNETAQMVAAAMSGGFSKARRIHYKILELMEANFIEASPAPCKFIMKEMGLLEEKVRLPLVNVSKPTQKKLRAILDGLNK